VVQAEVTKKMVTVRTLGALYVDKDIKITGSVCFCGHNHDYDTPPGTQTNKWVTCSGSHLATGNLAGVTSTGNQVQTSGTGVIQGDPVPIDNAATNPFYSISEVLGLPVKDVQKMLNNADNRSIVDPLNGVTYIVGDATINSNLVGEGLIYITGDLQASGDFTFKGLIYVEGDLHFSGSPWLLGSLIVRGKTDFNFTAGNVTVLYSSEALSRALNSSTPALVLSWREM
jgi:cytoskeletal protein CcmA (bactofilin family)